MRSLIITLFSTAIIAPMFCVCVILPVWLYSESGSNLWMVLLGPIFLFLMLNIAGIGGVFFLAERRNSRIDAIFAPWGLTGSAYNIFFRQYHGIVRGRNVSIYFHRGPVLEINVGTSLQTRMGASRSTPAQIERWLGRASANLTRLMPEGINVNTIDNHWFRRMVSHPGARDLLNRLTAPQSFFIFRHILLTPGNLKLYYAGGTNLLNFELNYAQTSSWLNDLLRLAHMAELAPAPTRADTESELERMDRSFRKNSIFMTWILAAVVGTSLGCLVSIILAAFLFT